MRNRFFSERLNLLPYNFNNLNILEFGPESGENSLSLLLMEQNLLWLNQIKIVVRDYCHTLKIII